MHSINYSTGYSKLMAAQDRQTAEEYQMAQTRCASLDAAKNELNEGVNGDKSRQPNTGKNCRCGWNAMHTGQVYQPESHW